ncbi:hypothetical protein [Conexibacter sp. DBS9H8]|uniref:hypothetical protein n=1 Tax=Conexibacter sp. DBS9H8 TaxID=2937801 RepID=UPI00200EAD0E|nr:hypothetical protein [Conexibacter sp. DBS9H8]
MGPAGDRAAYEALLADISAGVRLHYESDGSADPDLDLLRGDERYAAGLGALAQLGDLRATVILGDAISTVASAYARGDREHAKSAWEQALHTVRGGRYWTGTHPPDDSR